MNDTSLITQWLVDLYPDQKITIASIDGDASTRCYYRVEIGRQQLIILDSRLDDSLPQFIKIANLFKSHDLSVPEIVAYDLDKGFLLMTDLGDKLYFNSLSASNVDQLYYEAIDALLKIQLIPSNSNSINIPTFTKQLSRKQLSLFEDWFIAKQLRWRLSVEQSIQLEQVYQQLYNICHQQPFTLCHVDYHSRNLLVLPKNNPGIIDFQDAWLGPISYDLVSLLQDCYLRWPREKVEKWVGYYQKQAQQMGLLEDMPPEDFLMWFDITGVQRHLKNLGIFTRLHFHYGRSGYLNDIPRVINNILDACNRYAILNPLLDFFEQVVFASQPRYQVQAPEVLT